MTNNKEYLMKSYKIYKPKYVLFDLSNDIYPRDNKNLQDLKKLYNEFNLKLLLKDDAKKLYFFQLFNPVN